MSYKETETQIKENWFKNHVAKLTQHGDMQVLEWRQPGTSNYYCKYVFDNNKIYISGDIGEAVFSLTWKAEINSFDDIYLGYFEEKLSAYSGDRRDFSSERAVKRLREWATDLKDDGIKYDNEKMRTLFEGARSCSRSDEWAYEYVNNDELNEFISELHADYWEWMYKIGDEIPCRVQGYLVGLKMAADQLKEPLEMDCLGCDYSTFKVKCPDCCRDWDKE